MPELITVAEVRYPQPGKKQGVVMDTMGRRWQVWARDVPSYAVGQSYNVLSTKSTQFNGSTYTTIMKFEPAGPAAVSNNTPQMQGRPMAVPSVAIPASDDARRMDIFICGALNHILGNPNVTNPLYLTETDLIPIIRTLAEAWRATLGRKAQPPKATPNTTAQSQGAPDDEIPF